MEIFDSWIVNTLIAHRGLHDTQSPENSLPAFENAIKQKLAIEIDVHILKDDTIVVFHDDTLKRMTNQDGYISSLEKTQLKNYFLKNTTHTIPTLEEVLALVNGQVPMLIEIKNTGKVGKLEEAVLKQLSTYNGEFAVQSFNPFSLNYFYNYAPHILRGQLSGNFEKSELSGLKKYFLKRMWFNKKISKPDFIAYQTETLPNRFVKKYNHLPLLAWCVSSQEEYLRVIKHCDNIIFEGFEPKI